MPLDTRYQQTRSIIAHALSLAFATRRAGHHHIAASLVYEARRLERLEETHAAHCRRHAVAQDVGHERRALVHMSRRHLRILEDDAQPNFALVAAARRAYLEALAADRAARTDVAAARSARTAANDAARGARTRALRVTAIARALLDDDGAWSTEGAPVLMPEP